jgi:hypothetical protein
MSVFVHGNSSKTESAANTATTDQVEIPGSAGAKQVFIRRIELDIVEPDYVAASNTTTRAAACAGKIDATGSWVSQPGVITSKSIRILSTGAAGFAAIMDGPSEANGRWEVFKDNNDGKFYITFVVHGNNNTGAKAVRYTYDAEVIK